MQKNRGDDKHTYQNEHKHKIGVDGWTVEQNLVHRKKYAPDILGENKRCA